MPGADQSTTPVSSRPRPSNLPTGRSRANSKSGFRAQIFKPIEGSRTLRQWRLLATPSLFGAIASVEPAQGVRTRGMSSADDSSSALSDLDESELLPSSINERIEAQLNLEKQQQREDRKVVATSSPKHQPPTTGTYSFVDTRRRSVDSSCITSTFSLSMGLAKELHEREIPVSALAPTPRNTTMTPMIWSGSKTSAAVTTVTPSRGSLGLQGLSPGAISAGDTVSASRGILSRTALPQGSAPKFSPVNACQTPQWILKCCYFYRTLWHNQTTWFRVCARAFLNRFLSIRYILRIRIALNAKWKPVLKIFCANQPMDTIFESNNKRFAHHSGEIVDLRFPTLVIPVTTVVLNLMSCSCHVDLYSS